MTDAPGKSIQTGGGTFVEGDVRTRSKQGVLFLFNSDQRIQIKYPFAGQIDYFGQNDRQTNAKHKKLPLGKDLKKIFFDLEGLKVQIKLIVLFHLFYVVYQQNCSGHQG